MKIELILATITVFLSVVFAFLNPDSLNTGLLVLFSTAFFGLIYFLDAKKDDRFQKLETQIKSLQEKIEILSISKGFGG